MLMFFKIIITDLQLQYMQNLHPSFASSRCVPALHPFHAFFVGVSEGKKKIVTFFPLYTELCVLFFSPNLCDNQHGFKSPSSPFLFLSYPHLSVSMSRHTRD